MRKLKKFKELSKSLSVVKEENSSYQEAIVKILTYMISLNNIYYPLKYDFENEPEVYESILKCYRTIENMTTDFTLNLYADLNKYPGTCLNGIENIEDALSMGRKKITKIIECLEDPNTEEEDLNYQIDLLIDYMVNVINEASESIKNIDILIEAINKFMLNDVSTIAKEMNEILTMVGECSSEYNLAKKMLEETQIELEKEIESQIHRIIADSSIIFVTFIISAITVAVTALSGGTALPITLSVIAALGAVGGSCVPLIMDSVELSELQDELQETIEKIDDYEKDILLFASWEKEVEKVQQGLGDMLNNFKIVRSAWVDVEKGFSTIVECINNSKEDVENNQLDVGEWEEIDDVLEECQEVCEETSEKLKTMEISEITVSDASLALNMTEEEILSGIKNSDMHSFKEYMLSA